MANKIFQDADAALRDILFDGMTIVSSGFGLTRGPESEGCAPSRRRLACITGSDEVQVLGPIKVEAAAEREPGHFAARELPIGLDSLGTRGARVGGDVRAGVPARERGPVPTVRRPEFRAAYQVSATPPSQGMTAPVV